MTLNFDLGVSFENVWDSKGILVKAKEADITKSSTQQTMGLRWNLKAVALVNKENNVTRIVIY
jgi:hypothetical protein